MGRKKPNKVDNSTKVLTTNYGTHSDAILKVGEVNINVITDDIFGSFPIVVAKDGDEKYVTSMRHIDSGLLDPYKTYSKNKFTIVENVVNENDISYTITNNETNQSITI